MRKQLIMIPLLLLMAGCASDSPSAPTGEEGNNEETPQENLKNLLCDGDRFIDRDYEDHSSPSLGVYKSVRTQREYTFSENGKGSLTTYVAENTPRGYSMDVSEFTWTATTEQPASVTIMLSYGENINLNDVKIADGKLTSTSQTWSKEIKLESPWDRKDIRSYTADFTWYESNETQPPFLRCIVFSPSRITVDTSTGKATFITREFGESPTSVSLPAYSKDGGPLTYYDSYIYACVDTKTAYYPYSFFDIVTETKEKPFSENGKMYFYLGEFNGEKKQLHLIESNKKYTPEN